METPTDKPTQISDDKLEEIKANGRARRERRAGRRGVAAIAAAAGLTAAAVIGANIADDSDPSKAKTTTTTEAEAPSTTSTTELLTPGIEPDDGESGGVVVTPDNPEENKTP